MDVPTQHGVIRGQVVLSPFGTEVEQFLGIPYAIPPIDSKRFENPELYGQFSGGNCYIPLRRMVDKIHLVIRDIFEFYS